jgi:hypothetical protein
MVRTFASSVRKAIAAWKRRGGSPDDAIHWIENC